MSDDIRSFITDFDNIFRIFINDTKYESSKVKDYLENVGTNIIIADNYYYAHILHSHIKRWNKLSENKFSLKNNTFFILLRIYLNMKRKRRNDDLIKVIKEYFISKDNQILMLLLKDFVSRKMFGSIDKLANIINLYDCVSPASINEFTLMYKSGAKSNKYYKFLNI